MLFSSVFAAVLSLSSSALASPVHGAHYSGNDKRVSFESTVIEKLNGPPVGWVKDAEAKMNKDSEKIKLRVHLVQQDMDKFHEMAMNVRNSYLWLGRY